MVNSRQSAAGRWQLRTERIRSHDTKAAGLMSLGRLNTACCHLPSAYCSVQQAREVAAEVFGAEFGAGAGLLQDEPAGVGVCVGDEEELFARARVAEVADCGGGE